LINEQQKEGADSVRSNRWDWPTVFSFAAVRLLANIGKFWGDITISEDDSEIKTKVERYKVIKQSYKQRPLN
jgi:hypothetical protein